MIYFLSEMARLKEVQHCGMDVELWPHQLVEVDIHSLQQIHLPVQIKADALHLLSIVTAPIMIQVGQLILAVQIAVCRKPTTTASQPLLFVVQPTSTPQARDLD